VSHHNPLLFILPLTNKYVLRSGKSTFDPIQIVFKRSQFIILRTYHRSTFRSLSIGTETAMHGAVLQKQTRGQPIKKIHAVRNPRLHYRVAV
jgi:hypothetical protein